MSPFISISRNGGSKQNERRDAVVMPTSL